MKVIYCSIFAQQFTGLKRAFLILTLAIVLLQTFSKGIIVLGFKVNRDFIAKNLCVKKDEANNCCKGSCQLNKQLKEDDQNDPASPVRTGKDNSEVQLFCEIIYSINTPQFTSGKPTAYFLFPPTFSPGNTVFHPPLQA